MNLFINSPAYYTQTYGVIDEIYQLCSYISRNIDITSYTECIDTVGIVPIIAPTDVIGQGLYRESKRVSLPYRMAGISLRSDYEAFMTGNIMEKQQIIVENILRSLKIVKKKLSDKFDYEKIEHDIMETVNNFYRR